MSSSLDPRDYSGIYFNAKSSVSAPATAPYKALQATLRSEMVGITKSREKMIPILKALHEQWKLDQTPFPKFDDLLIDTFGKSRRWVWQFLKDLGPEFGITTTGHSDADWTANGEMAAPTENRQSQVVVLAKLPQEPLDNVATKATSGPPPPIGALHSTGAVSQKPAPPTHPVDETGERIPTRCLDLWNAREDVQPWMHMASQLKCFIQNLGQSPSGNYSPLSGQTISLQKSATDIFRWLELCKPYAVCYACRGTGSYSKDQCPVCYGAGLISRNTWNDDWTVVGMNGEKAAEVVRRKALCSL